MNPRREFPRAPSDDTEAERAIEEGLWHQEHEEDDDEDYSEANGWIPF